MSMIKEFREFAVKGNMIDMAVGIIVGAAFGKIVSSLVADVIMPPIGMIIGGVDFTGLSITLKEATATAPAVAWKIGSFVQAIVDFTIVAFAIFLLVKGINKMKRKEQAAPTVPVPPTSQELLLGEIRDILKSQGGAGGVVKKAL